MTQNNSFLPMLRESVRGYQAFEQYSSSHIRGIGLTPSQFDIIATLGMTFKELYEKTHQNNAQVSFAGRSPQGSGLLHCAESWSPKRRLLR
jgi:hypothetical protein